MATGQSDGRAVLFRAGQVIDLGVGAGSGGLDINEFGEVVGFRQSGADTVAFRWLNGKVADLAPLAGDTGSFAVAVNDSGQAVGFSSPSGRPVLWAADGTARDLSGTKLVRASGINNSGQIIGEVALAPGRNVPALVSGGRTTVLTSTLGAAADINDLGEVTGFFLDENAHGSFSWDAGLLTNIPQLPGARVSQAAAVNNHATVVGISDLAGSWVWDGGRLQALPQPDGRLVGAADINDHGQIVGVLTSTPAHPNPHAVLLQPVLTS